MRNKKKEVENIEIADPIEMVTPGQMLKEARIARGLSIGDIAKKLRLRESLIENMELNVFDDLATVTFVRGYLKSYARLVHIEEQLVLNAFEFGHKAEKQQLEMQSFSNRALLQSQDNWLAIISGLVVAIIVVMLVVWWYQREQASDPLPMVDIAIVQVDDTEIAADPTGIADGELTDPVDDLSADPSADLSDDPSATDSPIGANDDEGLASTELAQSANETASDATDSQPATEAETDPEVDDPRIDDPSLAKLALHFTEDCWVNIHDSTGKRIAIGTKAGGHVSIVYGVPPFSIKLGKPDGVSIYLQDELQTMPFFPKGSIANFELDLNNSDQ